MGKIRSHITDSSLVTKDVTAGDPSNHYIEQYLKGKENGTVTFDRDIVDPEVEDMIIRETLSTYFQADLKVGSILTNHYTDIDIIENAVSTKKDPKLEIIQKIINVHPVVSIQDQEILLGFLSRYAYSLENQQAISFLESNVQDETVSPSAAYDGDSAGNWAYKNYNKYRTDYPRFTGKFGTDCTNFVSQAMHIGGGKPKSGNWSISRKNTRYWVINSVEQLNYSWKLTNPSPWIAVRTFENYWRPKSKTHSMSTDYYRKNHKTIYNRSISKGDVVILHKGVSGVVTVPSHVMIISEYDSNKHDFKLAGHSVERQAHPLLTAIGSYAHLQILEIP
ncbi:amidase domain-containing protein [Thermoactinomyces sp. DSM 45892]|uniref:amidase domain-containing protein n=1 Tax=Thermoactinomyces sp. DSM 45892 TaxID=1882753 RepID=UPI00089BD10D|nr:amidase domain-containing protein [Thermoactinomyces sp. DSM 45892]SDY83828.1 Putative amidase domain-containing protein [Thermoactinomyces sp. DSM 45892]